MFDFFSYCIAQFAGSLAAGGILTGFFDETAATGANQIQDPFSPKVCFGIEIVLTFFLVYVILATSTRAAVIGAQSALAAGAAFSLGIFGAW